MISGTITIMLCSTSDCTPANDKAELPTGGQPTNKVIKPIIILMTTKKLEAAVLIILFFEKIANGKTYKNIKQLWNGSIPSKTNGCPSGSIAHRVYSTM